MKTIQTSLCSLFLLGTTLLVSAQNTWTGTDVPTTTSGKVGINTTPAAWLDINSLSTSAIRINHGQQIGSGNPTNIMEVYKRIVGVSFPPTLINWLGTNGVFGLSSLANTANESRMLYNDKDGNIKSSGLVTYSSPSFGNGTIINSIRGVAYLSFVFAGGGTPCGFCTISGGTNGIYMDALGVGKEASSAFNMDVLGNVRAGAFITTSDKRLKDNIKELNNTSPGLLSLNSYSYTFKNNEDSKNERQRIDTQKLHFGFIAQEVEKEFPNLVSIDEKGNYALNYIEFIPLLLEELKSQKKEISDLNAKIAAMEAKVDALAGNRLSQTHPVKSLSSFSLEQNVPNPFNQETVIRFNAEGENIMIGIFDLSGRKLQSVLVKKGEKQISVSARTLTPGTYIYNLIVDGKSVDSKKMIVTY